MQIPRRILVPLDYSEPSLRALEYGVALARPLRASVTAFHAYGEMRQSPYAVDQREHAERLDRVLRRYKGSASELTGMVRFSLPADGVNHVAEEIDADLVIMGTHGREGMKRALLGSVTESVLRDSTRPIVTIPPAYGETRRPGIPARMVVATDLSSTSEPAVDYAVDLAALIGATVTLLHACALTQPVAAARAGLEQAAAAGRSRGAAIDAELRASDPAGAIRELADAIDADLIVLGTRGRKGLARVFAGSVAEGVIRAATRPVLTVRTAA